MSFAPMVGVQKLPVIVHYQKGCSVWELDWFLYFFTQNLFFEKKTYILANSEQTLTLVHQKNV